jgi:hypothetical protein
VAHNLIRSPFSLLQKEDDVHTSSSSAEMPASVSEMNGGDHHIPGSSFSCLMKVKLLKWPRYSF